MDLHSFHNFQGKLLPEKMSVRNAEVTYYADGDLVKAAFDAAARICKVREEMPDFRFEHSITTDFANHTITIKVWA